MNQIIQNTIQSLLDLSDPNQIPFLEMMIPTKQKTLGIKAPALRKVLKPFKLETKNLNTRDQIKLAIELINSDIFEATQLAYEYIGKNQNLVSQLTKADLILMNKNLDNWATVDTFGVYVYGKAWQLGILLDEDIIQLAQHELMWQRRLALVSTIPFNQKSSGGNGDVNRTLMICDLLINDHHDLIVKALSWALRKLGTMEPEAVKAYLVKNETTLHKRIIREVRNKLLFGKKNL